ncbi:hypothetical protein VNO78_22599 [Psophocarpus tetragonolobus]|uniref:adenylate dimethylallyltransferase (ADP/ATP-dependent) n=1 Tax=Psophocarpus tetragonolobus TaxID=3891 RepID=A0AAN9S397_PSOTE
MKMVMVSAVKTGVASLKVGEVSMEKVRRERKKEKVVVIMGATGTGKSKLAIELATQFRQAEIVNSDKMQVYEGLEITTNKVRKEECRGVRHHLLGTVDPKANFTANDFCKQATVAVESILKREALPIIAGGSNSFLEALVNHYPDFSMRYTCCFLWLHVSLPVLHSSLSARVDRMIRSGLLHEVQQIFQYHNRDYSLGIRRAIGVPEFHDFFSSLSDNAHHSTTHSLLHSAISSLKLNNCNLATKQLLHILRLYSLWQPNMHLLDATEVFRHSSSPHLAHLSWHHHVFSKSTSILHNFFYDYDDSLLPSVIASPPPPIASATR